MLFDVYCIWKHAVKSFNFYFWFIASKLSSKSQVLWEEALQHQQLEALPGPYDANLHSQE